MEKNPDIIIIGAGLSGSLLALLLQKRGFNVSVFEKRNDPRFSKIDEGRSINLALSHRGIRALELAGVMPRIFPELIPMSGRMMHGTDSKTQRQAYGTSDQFINSVSRRVLNLRLIEAAAEAGVSFNFGYRCEKVDIDQKTLVVSDNQKVSEHQAEIIIGADGAFSAVRKEMMRRPLFNYHQDYISHGYVELLLPEEKGEYALDSSHLHIWPRGQFMLIALPNLDKTFTCTLFLPFNGEKSFDSVNNLEKAENFFLEQFPDLKEYKQSLAEQFINNGPATLVTIKCFPWHTRNSLLIGDSAHAIVPFYGQGMNAAFEDCRIFVETAESLDFEWPLVFEKFTRERKPDADAIAELALYNFIEMRDKVGDSDFLERKKTDKLLHKKYGEKWVPLYSQVTFTDTPYHQALAQGKLQESVLIEAQQNGYLQNLELIIQKLLNSK